MPHDPNHPTYVLAPHDDGTWHRAQLLSQHRRRGEWRVTVSYQVGLYTYWRGMPAAECRALTYGQGLRHDRLMASETHTVTYRGSVSDATLLVQMLEVRGIAVDWEGIPEQRSAREVVAADVLNLACNGDDEAIKAAVMLFRTRIPGAEVVIDDPQNHKPSED